MAVITGTIRGLQCVSRSFSGVGSREAWFITADFGAYDMADTAQLAAVGAAIDATCRDGKASTLRSGTCVLAGADTNKQAVYFTGTAVQALTVIGDGLAGQLSNAAGVEVTATGLDCELGIFAVVDRV